MPGKYWEPEEDHIIIQYYVSMGAEGIQRDKLPNRTLRSIRHRALYIRRNSNGHFRKKTPWTKEEDEILLKYFEKLGRKKLAGTHLKNRSVDAIGSRWTKLTRDYRELRKTKSWTDEEIEQLKQDICRMNTKELTEKWGVKRGALCKVVKSRIGVPMNTLRLAAGINRPEMIKNINLKALGRTYDDHKGVQRFYRYEAKITTLRELPKETLCRIILDLRKQLT